MESYNHEFVRFGPDSEETTLKQCDVVVWVGDLNYRVAMDELSPNEIRDLAEKWEINELLRYTLKHC